MRGDMRKWSSLPRRSLVLAGTVALGLAFAIGLPDLLLRLDIGSHGVRLLAPADRARAVNDIRATLLQGLAGGVLLAGAYFTWRQLQVSREGQITERYTRGVEQLGSDNRGVRVGGIYALERIAKDSAADRSTVTEVLTAFVRERATWQQRHGERSNPADPHRDPPSDAFIPLEELPYLRFRAPDVQAAMTVLGRLPAPMDAPARLELRDVDLRKGNLAGANLRGANLRGARLERVFLQGAHLEEANLSRTHLEGANLLDAYLEGADLRETDLRGAYNLSRAHLQGAIASRTRWPREFDPVAAGVTEVEPGSDEMRGRVPAQPDR
ncbi:MAG TPA: pentapeptide repeat-containing protein [Streptosporangiaceae bacterium]